MNGYAIERVYGDSRVMPIRQLEPQLPKSARPAATRTLAASRYALSRKRWMQVEAVPDRRTAGSSRLVRVRKVDEVRDDLARTREEVAMIAVELSRQVSAPSLSLRGNRRSDPAIASIGAMKRGAPRTRRQARPESTRQAALINAR